MAYGWGNYGGDDWDNFNWGQTETTTNTEQQQQQQQETTSANTATTPGVKQESTSYSSMPQWWKDNTKGWLEKYQKGKSFGWLDNIYDQYFKSGPKYQGEMDTNVKRANDFWGTYQQMPGQIENKRQSLIEQIYSNLPKMRELYQPTMEDMSRRGILNSSVTGSALGDIQEGVNRELMGKVAEANTWAADKNLAHTEGTPDVLAKIQSLTSDASDRNTQYGKDSAAFSSNYQGLINQLYEMLKETSQTSKTYNV